MRRALAALALAVVLPLPCFAQVVVKPGETLGEIAERYGVSVNRLMQANGIKDPTLVQIGQRLVIPGRSTGGGSGRASGSSVVVQSGDTIGEIAERYGVSAERLMQANGIKDPTLVQIGQRLVIPGRGGAAQRNGTSGGSRVAAGGRYTVQSGETLGEIAERFNTSVNRLMQLNGISDPTQLQAGSRILVPGSVTSQAARPAAQAPRSAKTAKEHVVQPGESLSEIADAYNLPLQKLVSLNNISDPNLLMSGTRLKLSAPPPVPAARPAARPPKAAVKPKPAVAAKPKPKPATTASPAAPAVATAKPASTPAATTTAPVATQPRPSRAPAASTPAATAAPAPATAAASTATATAKPSNTAAQANTPATTATTTTAAATSTPATAAPAATPRPATTTQVAARPAPRPRPATTTTTAAASKPAGPDWRSYGPLQVDWANWQPMGGSFVAPSLNAEGQPLYTAINCGARKLNSTSQTGQWRTWEAPRSDAEQQLVNDLCKAKGS